LYAIKKNENHPKNNKKPHFTKKNSENIS